jgi:hypothetical protein
MMRLDHVRPPVTRLRSRHFPPTVLPGSVDWPDFEARYEACQTAMHERHAWFEDGHNYGFRPAEHRNIALGRVQFYIQFVDFFFETYGRRLYLLDFMLRREDLDGHISLLYYIEDAAEIHVNLEGVTPEELRHATVGYGRAAASKMELGIPFATAWEINQIFHKGLLPITWFHTGSAMSRRRARLAMGGAVPADRILDDNRRLLSDWRAETKGAKLESLPFFEEATP